MNENSNKVRTSIKEALFDENRDLLDIIYYLGQGFMLVEQIYTYGSFLYGLSKDRIRRKIINLHGKGLLLEKQATTTNTKIYVLNKYVLSKYKSKSSQDVSSVKITDNKLWKNFYVNEFIIRNILPCINKNHLKLSISTIFGLLEDNFTTFMYSQNRHDVFKIYGAFYDKFETKNTEDFNKDYYALTSDLYNYGRNFLNLDMPEDDSEYQEIKRELELDKSLYPKKEDRDKRFYNLYQFVMNGFFFDGVPKDNTIPIGLFCKNLTFEKIYKQSGYILLMLERYLGYKPILEVYVYISDIESACEIKKMADRKSFNFSTYEFNTDTKKYELYKSLGIGEQYYENIKINYVNFDLINKYNL